MKARRRTAPRTKVSETKSIVIASALVLILALSVYFFNLSVATAEESSAPVETVAVETTSEPESSPETEEFETELPAEETVPEMTPEVTTEEIPEESPEETAELQSAPPQNNNGNGNQGGNSGAIWTTLDDCGTSQQNVNEYELGDTVYINGDNFDPNTQYDWHIQEPGANGAIIASGTLTTDGNGAFCIDAHTIGEDEDGVYQVKVDNKNDNYHVNGGDTPPPPPPPPVQMSCPFLPQEGRTVVDFDRTIKIVSSDIGPHESGPINASILAGTYTVRLASYDSYPERIDVEQPHEQWFAKLFATSSLVATSSVIGDLADFATSSFREEIVDAALVVPTAIDQVSAYHAYYPDGSNANSVFPLCAAFDRIQDNNEPPVRPPEVPPESIPTCELDVELINNGGFELPEVTHPYGWDIFPSSATGMSWLIEWISDVTTDTTVDNIFQERPENAVLEYTRSSTWLPSEGAQFAELDSDWTGPSLPIGTEPAAVRISQDIPTVPGKAYRLSFDFSPRPNTSTEDNVLLARWGGSTVDSISAAGSTTSVTSWTSHQYDLTATSSLTRISLEDAGIDNSEGTFIDNVSLMCVGDPVEPPVDEEPILEESNRGGDSDDNDDDQDDTNSSGSGTSNRARGYSSSNGGNGDSDGEVLGASISCGLYLNEYIMPGHPYNPEEVKKLQTFLNEYLGLNIPVTGVYGFLTYDAVKQFQLLQRGDVLAPWVEVGLHFDVNTPTGYVYMTTKRQINNIVCPELNLPLIPAVELN